MRTSRTLAAVAAATLSLSLAACGDSDQKSSSSSTSQAAAGGSGTTAPGGSGTVVSPKNLEAKSQGLIANPDGAAGNTLGVYIDPQCGHCADAEKLTGGSIDAAATAKTARIVLHPMTFMDKNMKNDRSVFMTNALACASDTGKSLPFMRAMFENQKGGYPDAAAGEFADKAGISGGERSAFDSCVAKKTYVPWLAAAQDQYSKDGVNSTPAYFLNGEKLDLSKTSKEDFEKKLAGSK